MSANEPSVTRRLEALSALGPILLFVWFALVPMLTILSLVLAVLGVGFVRDLWGFDR